MKCEPQHEVFQKKTRLKTANKRLLRAKKDVTMLRRHGQWEQWDDVINNVYLFLKLLHIDFALPVRAHSRLFRKISRRRIFSAL